MIQEWVKIAESRWMNINDNDITVQVNHEYLDPVDEKDEQEEVFLVFPAYENRGIPNSPQIVEIEGDYEEALKFATSIAEMIMGLPLHMIKKFEWKMIYQ